MKKKEPSLNQPTHGNLSDIYGFTVDSTQIWLSTTASFSTDERIHLQIRTARFDSTHDDRYCNMMIMMMIMMINDVGIRNMAI